MEPGLNNPLLSPSISYYIRKLLRQNFDRLKFVVALGAGLRADPLADLNAVLESLYMEPEEIVATISKLERLASYHQILSNQGSKHRQELDQVEQEIFWLLGFKRQEVVTLGSILVVDDVPENLRLLSVTLTKNGYETRSSLNGEAALKTVQASMPDLILLDVMMPDMDGYETCRRLKADPQTSEIPVIFLSAIDKASDKVQAFEAGGADYITKPFQIEEVLTRIEHQLKIRNLQKRLEEQNVSLQQQMHVRDTDSQNFRLTQLILRKLADYILVVDAKGQIVYANPPASEKLGYSIEELRKLKLWELEESLTVDTWRSQWDALKHQGSLHYTCNHRSNVYASVEVSVTAVCLEFNGQDYACITACGTGGKR